MKWRNFSYDDSRRIIKKLDLEKTKAGSRDEVYWYFLDGKKQLRIIMPNQHGGSGSLSTGFIKSIMINLHLKSDQLQELVDCSLSADQYEKIIREKLMLQSGSKNTQTE